MNTVIKLEQDSATGQAITPPPPPFCDPGNAGQCTSCGDDCDDDDVEMNMKGKLKSTCEKCSTAKVKCSGEIPCQRCVRKGYQCEYKMEKKRGRRTVQKVKKDVCTDASCWGQVIMNPISKTEDFGARFGLESVERRLFQVFFSIYKHHATPQSCCRDWFTYQLNKMSTFMLQNGNKEGQEKLDAWMEKKGIQVTRHDPSYYCKVPANVVDEVSGRKLPPIHPMKGPKLLVAEEGANMKRKRNKAGAQVYSTKGFYNAEHVNSPINAEINKMHNDSAFIHLRSTHEQFEIEVNEEFTALFGYTTADLISVLERLFGGLLPWGCDILAIIMSNDNDLLFFMRTLALKFNQIGRPPKFPATRQIMSSHIFEFDTKAGDVVECLLKAVHREYLSLERTEVDIYIGLEPMFPDVPRLFRDSNYQGEKKQMVSLPAYVEKQQQQFQQLSRHSSFNDEAKSYGDISGGQLTPSDIPYTPPQNLPIIGNFDGNASDIPENELEGLDFLEGLMNWTDDVNPNGNGGPAPMDMSGSGIVYMDQQQKQRQQPMQQQPMMQAVQPLMYHQQPQPGQYQQQQQQQQRSQPVQFQQRQQQQQQQQQQQGQQRSCALDLLPETMERTSLN